jgi:hypothetical protein
MHRPGEELRKLLGRDLPAEAILPRAYDGPVRLIVPTVRTVLAPAETLTLKVLILAKGRPAEAALYWRELGRGEYAAVSLENVGRGVYKVSCPEADKDLEYYVKVKFENEEVFFPPTAPLINQTVVRTR